MLIAVPAIALDLLTTWVSSLGVTERVSVGLSGAKMTIFGADLLLFLIFMLSARYAIRWYDEPGRVTYAQW